MSKPKPADQPTAETTPAVERPASITLICILWVGGSVLQFLEKINISTLRLDYIIDLVISMVMIRGLWQMKRWGVCFSLASIINSAAIHYASQPITRSHGFDDMLLGLILLAYWNHAAKMK